MSNFATHPFLTGLAVTLGVSLLVFVATWLLALRVGRFNIVDTTWGLSFAVIAGTSFLWSSGHRNNDTRRTLVLALTCIWGVRLATYIGVRSRGHGEDPRYEKLLSRAKGSRAVHALVMVFLLQALIAWFVSLPVQAAMYERSSTNALAWIGATVWAIGVFFEAVGDAQLAAFKRDPATKGTVLDRGLWRYTRHPNYFGDACLWFGIWLVAAQQWPGALTVLSPAVMYYFLSFKSGKPMLEKAMAKSKPGYAEYMQRTSGFFPLPPRRSRESPGT